MVDTLCKINVTPGSLAEFKGFLENEEHQGKAIRIVFAGAG